MPKIESSKNIVDQNYFTVMQTAIVSHLKCLTAIAAKDGKWKELLLHIEITPIFSLHIL